MLRASAYSSSVFGSVSWFATVSATIDTLHGRCPSSARVLAQGIKNNARQHPHLIEKIRNGNLPGYYGRLKVPKGICEASIDRYF
jgi:hypothetical protein